MNPDPQFLLGKTAPMVTPSEPKPLRAWSLFPATCAMSCPSACAPSAATATAILRPNSNANASPSTPASHSSLTPKNLPSQNPPPSVTAANRKWHPSSKSSPAGKWDAIRRRIPHARHNALLQAVPQQAAYSKITNQAPQLRGQKYSKAHRRQEMASAELALEAKNTLPSSFDSDRRGDFQRPGGLVHTPRSPVSNINRIRPASPLQTGLVQPWVQSEGSCLASATPLNVRRSGIARSILH